MNKVCLTGRLTNKVELRYTTENKAIGNFTLAVNRTFKNNEGNYDADFIRCAIFGMQAETLTNYTNKGSLIGLEGRIQTGSYDDKDGKRVYTTDVIVDRFDFLETKRQETTTEEEPEDVFSKYEEQKRTERDIFSDYGDIVSIDDNFLD